MTFQLVVYLFNSIILLQASFAHPQPKKSQWMAEGLAPLPAMQVARVQSPVPAGPTISAEKVALFCNTGSGTRFQALQLRLKMEYKFAVAKAKVFLHLEAQVRVGRGIQHSKDSLSLFMVQYLKDTSPPHFN
jgi:hypothetical protein